MSARPGVPDSTTRLPIGDLEDPVDDHEPAEREPVAIPVIAEVPDAVVVGGLRGRFDDLSSRIAAASPLSGPSTPLPAAGRVPRERQLVAERIAGRARQVYGLTNTLAVPLTTEEEVIGAIVLSHRTVGAWSATTRRILNGAAVEASAALSRAYSHQAAQAQASTDALTGLPNRRYFDEFCGLLARRRRSGDAVGVLMIDIDRFKVLNDTHGHATGDEVLRAVGGAIVSAVREDDVPARYGGEEFVVLLRNPTPAIAIEVGERVRSSVASLTSGGSGCGVSAYLSVSRSPGGPRSRSASSSPRQTAHCTGPSAVVRGSGRRRLTGYHRAVADDLADLTDTERTDRDPTDADLTNGDLARIFHEIGDMLELKGELVRRRTTSGAVPAGALSPFQESATSSGKPCSARVGTSGSRGDRSCAAMPRMRTRLSPTSGRTMVVA